MCFNKEWSLIFTGTSLFFGGWVVSGHGIWKNIESWQRWRVCYCFIYFAAMEALQFFQYLVINDCQSSLNIFLTFLGFIHICWQPLFSNIAFSTLDFKNFDKKRDDIWKFIFKFAFASGLLMSFRILIPAVYDFPESFIFEPRGNADGYCGEKTCTTNGIYHLKWEFKLLKSTYAFPNMSAHCLFMFVCPFILGLRIQSIILFLTGPFISVLFPGPVSDGERSSIWCFFSIAESFITVITCYIACRRQLNASLKQKQQ